MQGPCAATLEAQLTEPRTSLVSLEFPHLAELIVDHASRPGYDFSGEFDYGLELILDALEACRE